MFSRKYGFYISITHKETVLSVREMPPVIDCYADKFWDENDNYIGPTI